jgi:hypothetical protein
VCDAAELLLEHAQDFYLREGQRGRLKLVAILILGMIAERKAIEIDVARIVLMTRIVGLLIAVVVSQKTPFIVGIGGIELEIVWLISSCSALYAFRSSLIWLISSVSAALIA